MAEDAATKGKFHFIQPNEAYMTFNEGKDMLIMDNGVFTMINDGQESIAKGVTHKQFEVLLIVLRNYFRAIAIVRISKKWPTWKLRNKGISAR